MKISELLETDFEDSNNFCVQYKQKYQSALTNFDEYIRVHGTDGANVIFAEIINSTKDSFINFCIVKNKSYRAMIEARNRLEEKIKNSNGISYQ